MTNLDIFFNHLITELDSKTNTNTLCLGASHNNKTLIIRNNSLLPLASSKEPPRLIKLRFKILKTTSILTLLKRMMKWRLTQLLQVETTPLSLRETYINRSTPMAITICKETLVSPIWATILHHPITSKFMLEEILTVTGPNSGTLPTPRYQARTRSLSSSSTNNMVVNIKDTIPINLNSFIMKTQWEKDRRQLVWSTKISS